MPRRSRRSSFRRQGPKFDWVYRPTEVGEGAPDVGSYAGVQTLAIASGLTGAYAIVLYDSIDWLSQVSRNSNLLPRAARAEGRHPLIGAVDIDIAFVPDTWAEGGYMQWGWRLGWFEQDPTTGVPAVLDDYTMWSNIPDLHQPAIDANDPMSNIREWRTWHAFNEQVTSPIFSFHKFFTLRRRAPSSRHALCLYIEGAATSANIRMYRNCRTLVADEG